MEDWIRLGFFGLWGNKGANILTLNIGGMNLCFINSHLSAHEYQSKKREQEYSAILSTQKFSTVYYQETMVLKEDYQFIFGDLNFRIEGLSIDNVKELILKKEFEKLLEYDQVNNDENFDLIFFIFKLCLFYFCMFSLEGVLKIKNYFRIFTKKLSILHPPTNLTRTLIHTIRVPRNGFLHGVTEYYINKIQKKKH